MWLSNVHLFVRMEGDEKRQHRRLEEKERELLASKQRLEKEQRNLTVETGKIAEYKATKDAHERRQKVNLPI